MKTNSMTKNMSQINSQIDLNHQQEFKDSQIDNDIINLNFLSLPPDLAYEYLLYGLDRKDRLNNGRLNSYWLKQYEHLQEGGWWCSGYDLLNNKSSEWGCFKPNKPRIDRMGKLVKYETPPRVPTEIFALQVSDRNWAKIAKQIDFKKEGNNFWQWVINNHQIPIIVTEGAKKAAALLSAGYVAIALPGINNALIPDSDDIPVFCLDILCQKWRQITFAFDCDRKWKTIQAVSQAILKIGQILQLKGCEIFVAQWRASDGKGVDDLIARQGVETWHLIYERRQTLAEFENSKKDRSIKMDHPNLLKFLDVEFENRLKFNELKSQIILDGKVLILTDELRCWFSEEYKIKTNKLDLNDALTYQAKKKAFHPVKEYLERVARKADQISINNLASRYFLTSDPLYDIFFKRWLIAAVKRIFKPGSKMDYALILQGEQGIRKSTFFRVLGGEEWFSDSLGDINSKDALQLLHKFWIHELGELERITGKKAAGEIKVFLSKTRDDFRKPYDREIGEHPRMMVICGSVNKNSFLVDETGNRRFWVIPISEDLEQIDTQLLEQERDAIWGAAVKAYQRGESSFLTREEEKLCLINNDRFEVNDEWQGEVEQYLENRDRVSISEVLLYQFQIEPANQDRQCQMRISAILTRLDWYKAGRVLHLGKRQVIWKPKKLSEIQKRESLLGGMARYGVMADLDPNEKKSHNQPYVAHLLEDFCKNENPQPEKLNGKPRYVHPPNAFEPGERVVHDTIVYKVIASTHTHVLLEGFGKSIPIWQVERLEE